MFESVKFFLTKVKLHSFEKLNVETNKSLRKGLILWLLLRLSAVWYRRRLCYSEPKYGSVLQNLNIFNIFFGRCLVKFVLFCSHQKPHSNRVFPLFNHSIIVTYVTKNFWHHIMSCGSNFVDLLQNIKFFWTAELTA